MSISRLREAIRNGSCDPWADSVLWGGKGGGSPTYVAAAPAPDYTGAAVASAAGNKESAQAAQQGSMVNQNTPYGSLTYNQSGTWASGNPQYSANVNLSPVGQQLLDYGNQSALGLGALQNKGLANVDQAMAQPFDMSSVDDIYNKSYATQTSRLDPAWQAQDKLQASNLQNQGIMQGSEAYDNAMRTYGQTKNDAYQQAQQAAIAGMPQTYQMALQAREQPLNELNALRTGSQVTNPTFNSTPQQQYTQGPDYLGAAQASGQYGLQSAGLQNQYNMGLYNAGVGSRNSAMSGLMGLGGALGSAWMGMKP